MECPYSIEGILTPDEAYERKTGPMSLAAQLEPLQILIWLITGEIVGLLLEDW